MKAVHYLADAACLLARVVQFSAIEAPPVAAVHFCTTTHLRHISAQISANFIRWLRSQFHCPLRVICGHLSNQYGAFRMGEGDGRLSFELAPHKRINTCVQLVPREVLKLGS